MMIPQEILEKIDKNRQRYVEELLGFLRIPSVSTYTRHAQDVRKAAEWVLHHLKRLGLPAQLHETGGHPVVTARSPFQPDLPTLLIYGHYDVQPPEPMEEWITPPFSPSIRDGCVYARGATDDKGQFFTYLKAIEAVLAVTSRLPINVKVLVEGEEEIGSPNLEGFLKRHRTDLKADAVAVSDGSQFSRGVPAITYGLRGLSYFQIDLQGPRIDVHSGSFGGVTANPAQALAQVLAQMKNPDGTVAIPGFYESVVPLEAWERQELAALSFDEGGLKAYLGVDELPGEPGYTVLERKSARPTLDVNGIWGGFQGEGAKTIIPAKAGAKVSMRLVPNQSPSVISALFKQYVESLTPPGVRVTVTELHRAEPVLVSRDCTGIRAAARAIEIGFGKTPVFIREGGSIPIVNVLKEVLEIDSILLMGWGSPDDGPHSPNERLFLEDFHRGVRSAAALLYALAP
ncbi:MAG TPA: dipeptidase [Syntrophobacteraceae bacterium]|nr:dipeptidase [Syntrophobacteraceae bacterium]